MNRALALAGLLCLIAATTGAQEIYLQAQNHLELSHDTETEQDIFEDWFDVDLYGDGFLLGLRYSSFAPPDPIVSSDRESSEGITHRFGEVELGDTRLRAGTFTRLFGRGLVLRSFENRDLRIDTNLDGFLIEHHGDWWQGTLLSGRTESGQMETGERQRDNRFSGTDLAVDYGALQVGSSFLALERPDSPARPEFHGLRASLVDGPLRVDWEGMRHLPGDGRESGLGQVVELSYLLGPIGLYGGYKYYRDAAVLTHDQKLMNQPPVLIHDQRATLLNRHPHQLDPNDEKGLLADVSLSTPLGEFLVSYAETRHIDEEMGGNDYREGFVEWDGHDVFGLESMHVIVDYQKVPFLDASDFDHPHWVWDYFLTSSVDVRIAVAGGAAIAIWEHQHKSAEHVGDFDDDLVSLEYEAPGGWSLSFLAEYVNWSREQQIIEQQEGERKTWLGAQLAAPLGDHHEARLFVGGRREGFICVGGVCRFEPAFDGVELTLLSRL